MILVAKYANQSTTKPLQKKIGQSEHFF